MISGTSTTIFFFAFCFIAVFASEDRPGKRFLTSISSRRLPQRAQDEVTWQWLVGDCQFKVLWNLLDCMPLNAPSVESCIGGFKLVCSAWNSMFDDMIQKHPKVCYVNLRKAGWIVQDNPAKLQQLYLCKDLLSIEEAGQVLLRSGTEKVFPILSSAAAFSSISVEFDMIDFIEKLLEQAYAEDLVDLQAFPGFDYDDDDFETTHLYDISLNFAGEPSSMLEIPQKDLLLYLFLDNLALANYMGSFKVAIMNLFVDYYNESRLDELAELRDLLARTILPRTKASALFASLYYALTVAVFQGKRDFIQWIGLDYVAAKESLVHLGNVDPATKGMIEFLGTIEAYEKGRIDKVYGSFDDLPWMKWGVECLKDLNQDTYLGWKKD